MRFLLALCFSVMLVPATAVASTIDMSAGIEYFQWEEFDDGGRKMLDETGPRYFVALTGVDRLENDWLIDFSGRLYTGTVDYDGETQNHIPLTTETDYNGFRAELGFTHEIGLGGLGISEPDAKWLLRFAIGLDQWRRALQNTSLSDGTPVTGYVERYASTYAKMGAAYSREESWSLGIGAKAPFYTREEVGINGGVTLKPKGKLSLFVDAEFSLTPLVSVALAYDSYRFAKSDRVLAGSYFYWQPESTQDTLSLALRYRF